ncbi:unnamed protein product [Schistosoma rodhaini]|uniref:Secreted protein n=1 Tax=Schistosoma rodhaini TaxID=6188 RepID=A0AA85F9L0_9TREM|nr:unnamed protein product [Schistosoma rodhaini]
MKLIIISALIILLLLNVTAELIYLTSDNFQDTFILRSQASQKELFTESVKLWKSITELWRRFQFKCREKIQKYLEEDKLGEKLAAVVSIYVKRLNKRLDMRLSEDRAE